MAFANCLFVYVCVCVCACVVMVVFLVCAFMCHVWEGAGVDDGVIVRACMPAGKAWRAASALPSCATCGFVGSLQAVDQMFQFHCQISLPRQLTPSINVVHTACSSLAL